MDRKPLSRLLANSLFLAMFLTLAASTGWCQGAADFTLKDVRNGQTYTLSQLKGKVVLLNFFTFLCKPCREEMPGLNQLDREFKSQGFQVIGIGLASDPGDLRALTQQLGLDYPVLAGTDAVSKAYGNVEFVPTSFIIDRQGRIVHKITEARSKADFVKLIKPLL